MRAPPSSSLPGRQRQGRASAVRECVREEVLHHAIGALRRALVVDATGRPIRIGFGEAVHGTAEIDELPVRAGAQAMEELQQQMRDWAAGKELTVKHQPKQIAFNVIPRIDAVQDNAYTKEEMKFLWEGQKIMHHANLRATATCVRVPVLRSHAVSLNLEFDKPCTPDQAREILAKAPGVVVQDDPSNEVYPMPLERTLKDEIAVGRIRQDISVDDNRGLCVWAVGDQVMKGAALNAVQIGELLLSR